MIRHIDCETAEAGIMEAEKAIDLLECDVIMDVVRIDGDMDAYSFQYDRTRLYTLEMIESVGLFPDDVCEAGELVVLIPLEK